MNLKSDSSSTEIARSASTKRQFAYLHRWMLAGAAAVVVSAFSFIGISHANDGHGGFGRHGHGMGIAQMDPEMAAKRIDHMINRILADGTAEQKASVAAIAKAAISDLQPLRAQHRAAREQGIRLLTAPTIDRAAIEQLRVSQLQLLDQVSRRLSQALADTAEVLTPEQRVRLAERLRQHRGNKG
ncbi:Spy/CpxP family protein refolding chaperone [soil metagenome]